MIDRWSLLLILTGALALPAEAQSPDTADSRRDLVVGPWQAWLSGLEVDPRVARELGRFDYEDVEPDQEYREVLARTIRDLLIQHASARVTELANGACQDFVKADFLVDGVTRPDRGPVESRLEEGFVRTESVACFTTPTDDARTVLDRYTGVAFRRQAESRIERIWTEAGSSCVQTGGVWPLLDPTSSCNRIDRHDDERIAAEHSQVVWNQGGEGVQVVYFKESLKTFVRIPNGMALHYINFSRTVRLGRLQRAIGRGRIESSQREKAEAFATLIRNQPS